MNLWLISKYASIPKFGTGARLFYLANEFNKLGHPSTLITSDSNHLAKFPDTKDVYNKESVDVTPVVWIKTKKYQKTASIGRILSWLDFEWKLFAMPLKSLQKPDAVIISSLSIFTIVYGFYLKKKYGAILVFEIRDIWPLTMTEEGGFGRYHPLVLFIGLIEKFGYKNSDLVVGTMPRLDLHVKKVLGYDRPFFCSPLGFHSENYLEEKNPENPFEKEFPKNKTIIGYAGSMGITNALEAFVECIRRLDHRTDIHFMLLGSGDLKTQMEADLKDCSNVSFLSRVSQDKVKLFLTHCDILYLSTQDSEVWEYGQSMNKVVEYMLAGKPIIARYSGYPSMIDEANCGLFVKSNDAKDIQNSIEKLTNLSIEERTKLGLNGKKWVLENRPYSKLAANYINKILQLTGKN